MAVHAYILCYSRDTTLAPEKGFRGILKGLSSAPSHLNVPSPLPQVWHLPRFGKYYFHALYSQLRAAEGTLRPKQ